MNLLDAGLILVLVLATVRGVQVGALAQVLPLGGLVGGLVLGAAVAPFVEGLVDEGTTRVLVSLAVVFGVAAAGSAAGQVVASSLHLALSRHGLAGVDRAGGAVAGGAITAVVIWMTASMLATVPASPVAAAIQSSAVLRAADRVLPPAPALFARVQGLLEGTGLPPVFAGLERDPATARPLPGPPAVASAARRAGGSTFKVTGTGCGGVQVGSSFLATADLVVTNAHVVAGIDQPVVHTRRGLQRATPVVFDAALDIAVLRIGAPGARPLPIATAELPRGTTGAALGYPGGGPLQASPAVVTASYDAVGRDIYSRGLARRPVYELRARVRAGNSGGPVVTPAGDVIGVVFSRSAWHDDVGFAIRGAEVQRRVAQAAVATAAADTGACAL